MEIGCYTALITPLKRTGELDTHGLHQLIDFQIQNGITGILAVGTTGESPTLKWEEHLQVIADTAEAARGKCRCIAGAGSNNTREALGAVAHSSEKGLDGVLMVDPYYNGPSSLEMRLEYYAPIARAFPHMEIIPYIIPGRTGAKLLPEDLAILASAYNNVRSVKEATGDLDNMRRTRECCGDDFQIFSGDDGLVFRIMGDPAIRACGGISVLSNIVPGPLTEMIRCMNQGDVAGADRLHTALSPLLELVTVTTTEKTDHGDTVCRARNPLPLKTLMQILGLPSGPCRRPLGRMTPKGIKVVVAAARTVQEKNPELLQPLADFFGVDIQERLDNPDYLEGLYYTD